MIDHELSPFKVLCNNCKSYVRKNVCEYFFYSKTLL